MDDIYIAIPSASAKDRKNIIEICRKTGRNIKTLPGIYQLINGEVNISKLRNVEIEDLLGRNRSVLIWTRLWDTLPVR